MKKMEKRSHRRARYKARTRAERQESNPRRTCMGILKTGARNTHGRANSMGSRAYETRQKTAPQAREERIGSQIGVKTRRKS